jgi:hypothetical protein
MVTFPFQTGNTFVGLLDRMMGQHGQPVTLLRAPRKGPNGWAEEQALHVTALIGHQDSDEPIRWEQWGGGNLMNANPQWALFRPTVKPKEGDIAKLMSGAYYRITNINPADTVVGQVQGWLCQLVREQ